MAALMANKRAQRESNASIAKVDYDELELLTLVLTT